MPYYPAIRSFLSSHHGYYCEECLAARLNLSVNEIRRSVGQRTLADVSIAYKSVKPASTRRASSPFEKAPDNDHLKAKTRVRGCSSQCEELQSSSEVISAHFYHLGCNHYCASHDDHRCCVCRAKESRQQFPKAASRY